MTYRVERMVTRQDEQIIQDHALRCREGGWLDTPPQYRTNEEIRRVYALDAYADEAATRKWHQLRGLPPADRLAWMEQ